MKNERTQKADYSKLKQKLYRYLLLITVGAVLLVILLRGLTRGNIGDGIVRFLQRSFYLEYEQARTIYQYTIRNNLQTMTIVAIGICFLVLSRILFSYFFQCLDQINRGIDQLMGGGGQEIGLPPELGFMEQKLNTLMRTIEKREQEAQQAEQRKNDLVMYLAHDIKTPLTSVIGYLSLLDEAADMPPGQRAKYVGITLEKAYRLEQLINEFFEITRYNLQAITLNKQPVDLSYMLIQLADEVYPQLVEHGKQANVNAPDDLAVYGDPDKLARVFNNVLKNAIAYSKDNSSIDITASAGEHVVTVRFSNVGTIPPDKLTAIFEKFYRMDASRSTNTGGAGLGLAIAKEIVELHQGSIRAENSEGCTIFTIELPCSPEDGPVTPTQGFTR